MPQGENNLEKKAALVHVTQLRPWVIACRSNLAGSRHMAAEVFLGPCRKIASIQAPRSSPSRKRMLVVVCVRFGSGLGMQRKVWRLGFDTSGAPSCATNTAQHDLTMQWLTRYASEPHVATTHVDNPAAQAMQTQHLTTTCQTKPQRKQGRT